MSRPVTPRLGPELIGQRVVVRRKLPGGRTGDLLGELLSWDPAVVRTQHGPVSVPLAEVLAGKAVPPAPPRRALGHSAISLDALELLAADGWRPLELGWLGEPGQGWQLRAAQGFTGRGNSALAVGDPGLELTEAVDAVQAWYAARGLPGRICVPWPLDAPALEPDRARDTPLDAELRRRGWRLEAPTFVQTAALREVALATSREVLPPGLELRVADEPDEGWLGVYKYKGQELPPVARTLLLSAPAQVFISVVADGSTVAVGRGASAQGWCGVTAMEVAPSHRRQGLARVILGAIADWALRRGDRNGYLQVAEYNTSALGFYRGVGFTDHHGYQYRLGPAAESAELTTRR